MENKIKEEVKEESTGLNDIFHNEVSHPYKTNAAGQVISVGTDKDGNEIAVNLPSGGGLQIDPEILKKINDPDWIAHNRDAERQKNTDRLNNYFKNTKFSGPVANDFDNTGLFNIPKEFAHMLMEIENDDDELDTRSRSIIKNARQNSILVEPELMKGLLDATNNSLNYKNMPQLIDFMKHLKIENVDFNLLDMAGAEEYFKQWKSLRRPSMAIIIQRLVQEADELFFDWLKGNENLDDETKHILRVDVNARVEFLRDIAEESGQRLYSMEDFIIQKFHFQEYGLVNDDQEWFNREKLVPGLVGVTMGDYFDEFEARTGIPYQEVYSYWWKIVEDEEKAKELAETMGESYDKKSLVEGKDANLEFVEAEPEPKEENIVPQTVNYGDVWDEDDII